MNLDPDPAELRALAHRLADAIADWHQGLPDRPVARPPVAAELGPLVQEPLPRTGLGIEASWRRLLDDLLPRATLVNHPRFFAYIPGPGSFAGAVGEALAAALNPFVGTWLGGAVMAQLELQTLEWLRQAVGLPAGFTGLVTSGGSMANLTALAAALGEGDRSRAVVYASAEAHYSFAKSARVLGAGHVRAVPVDAGQRLRPEALRDLLAADRRAGLRPAVLCATAGTTSTGAVDPLPELAALAGQEGLWLHVDAAYGGPVALLPAGRALLEGWELADSITLDPHKWLYTPFECGCLLTRRVADLERTFAGDGHYMQDVPRAEVNFFTRGPELTRGARALKLWFVLRACGTEALAAAIEQDQRHCRLAHDLLAADPRIAIRTPVRMSVFTFAPRAGEAAGQRLVADLLRDGHAMLSSTRVDGDFALRFCVVNHRTTEADVRSTVACILRLLGGAAG